jgi:beta-lactamase regulating signal transducer with metallopeptidase domain
MNALEAWLGYLLSVGLRGSLLLGICALATLLLRKRSASTRHLVWAAGLGAVGAITALSWWLPAWRLEALPARPLSLLFVEGAAIAPPPLPMAGGLQVAAVGGGAPPTLSGGSGLAPLLFFVLWAVPCAALLLRLLVGTRGAAALIRSSRQVPPPQLQALAAEVAARAGLGPIEVRLSPAALSPVTAGLLRPIILLPLEAQQWPAPLQRAVLAHEMGHVRRHDCLTQLLARVVTAVHWWNPLCWLAEARMVSEREQACDDHVLADGARPSAYARHLLELGHLLTGRRGGGARVQGAYILGCVAGRSKLATRVETLLDGKRSHHLPGRRAALAALSAALLLALPAACLTGDPLSRESALLVYRVEAERAAETAAVLTRRLEGLGLSKARVTVQGRDRLQVELPARLPLELASVRAALERKGALSVAVVADDPAYFRQLAAAVWAHPEVRSLAGGEIHVVGEQWQGEQDGQLSPVAPHLRGPKAVLRWYVQHFPPALQPPPGHALVLDPLDADEARTLLVDRRRGLTFHHLADVQVKDSMPNNPTMFEVELKLAPEDATRLHALTSANVGQKLAIELDDGEVWGAPTIRSAIGERMSVTASGPRAEAQRLAAAFRAGSLPAPIELLFSSGGSNALWLGAATESR